MVRELSAKERYFIKQLGLNRADRGFQGLLRRRAVLKCLVPNPERYPGRWKDDNGKDIGWATLSSPHSDVGGVPIGSPPKRISVGFTPFAPEPELKRVLVYEREYSEECDRLDAEYEKRLKDPAFLRRRLSTIKNRRSYARIKETLERAGAKTKRDALMVLRGLKEYSRFTPVGKGYQRDYVYWLQSAVYAQLEVTTRGWSEARFGLALMAEGL